MVYNEFKNSMFMGIANIFNFLLQFSAEIKRFHCKYDYEKFLLFHFKDLYNDFISRIFRASLRYL